MAVTLNTALIPAFERSKKSHARFSANAAWYLVPTNMPDQAKGRRGKSSAPLLRAHALHLLGDVAAHPDQFDAENAVAHYQQALALAQVHGMRPLLAHCYLGLSKLYRRTGKPESRPGRI